MKKVIAFIVIVLTMGLIMSAHTGVAAESAADFYKKNRLTIINPVSPGGTYGYLSRLFGALWSEHTGGSVQVKHRVGGGGLAGMNATYKAKPNGLTIGLATLGSDVVAPALLGASGVAFDPRKFSYVLYCFSEFRFMALSPAVPLKTLDDVRAAGGFKFASTGARDLTTIGAVLVAEFLNLKNSKIVIGYSGLTETLLAVARGEVHGGLFQQSALKDFVDKGQLKSPLLIMARERLDLFPEAAPLTELATLSSKQETMFKVYEGMDLAKAFLAPPGIPADRLQFLRETAEKIFADKSFLRQAKLQWPIIAGGYDGAKLATKVNDIMGSISKEDVAELDVIVSNYLPK